MILETRAVEPFLKNGYVIGCEETREGVLIDPGDEVEQLLEAVDDHRLSIKYILLTHAHIDHVVRSCACVRLLIRKGGAKVSSNRQIRVSASGESRLT